MLLPPHGPIFARQRKVILKHQIRNQQTLLQHGDVLANAHSTASAESEHILLQSLATFAQPAFGLEGVRIWEDGGVSMGDIGWDRYIRLASKGISRAACATNIKRELRTRDPFASNH